MAMLGIEFLKFSSGVKQITISFDFVEFIFIQLFLVQLTYGTPTGKEESRLNMLLR